MSYLVALDAGHGKLTAGKRSPDESLFEYEFNRYVVSRIDYHLKRHGVDTLLIAPDDTDITLTTRCKIANDANVNIFVSIHANAYGDGKDWNTANGWEIYYSQGSTNGKKLAEAIYSESIPYLGIKDRGIKTTAEFTVVRKTVAPAVLVEHGFYTNKTEVELLKSDEFREKCAIADTKGILKYLGIEWIDEVVEPDYKSLYETTLALYQNTLSMVETQKLLNEKLQNKLYRIANIINEN